MNVELPLPAEPGRPGRRRCQNHRLFLYDANDPQRAELELFVKQAFDSRHSARVCSFMPSLLALRNDRNEICSVAGFRHAAAQPLFLEHYLDEPIELALSRATGSEVSRATIVEVGNLAGLSCRSAMRLVLALPRMLLDRGQRWIVFTATDTVRHLLANYHAPLIDLAPAVASRVQGLGDDWGRYYDTHPRILAGYLPDGLQLRRYER